MEVLALSFVEVVEEDHGRAAAVDMDLVFGKPAYALSDLISSGEDRVKK